MPMQRMRPALLILLTILALLELFCCGDESIREDVGEILKLQHFEPNIDAIVDHVCGMGYKPLSNATSIVKPEIFKCIVRTAVTNGMFGTAATDELFTRASLNIFDGLGHFLAQMIKILVDHDHKFQHLESSFMPEELSKNMIYLKNVEGVYKPNQNNSLYCHQNSYIDEKVLLQSTLNTIIQDHFECFIVPDFDKWFGFNLIKQNQMSSVRAAYSASTDKRVIACGKRAGQSKTLEISYHLRFGDLAEPFESNQKWRIAFYEGRLAKGLIGAKKVLEWLGKLESAMEGIGWKIHISVFTDTPYEKLKELFRKEHVADLRLYDEYVDGVTKHQKATAVNEQNSTSVALDFVGADSNPLISLHCLSAGDLLIRDHASFFSRLAVVLMNPKNSADPSTVDFGHIDQIVHSLTDRDNVDGSLGEYFEEDAKLVLNHLSTYGKNKTEHKHQNSKKTD